MPALAAALLAAAAGVTPPEFAAEFGLYYIVTNSQFNFTSTSTTLCSAGCYGNVWSITFALTIAVDRRRNENASNEGSQRNHSHTERGPEPCRVTNMS